LRLQPDLSVHRHARVASFPRYVLPGPRPGATTQGMSDEPITLREEMRHGFSEIRGEFAAVREEIRRDFDAVREEMRQEFAAVRGEMGEGFAEIRQQIGELRQQLAALSSRVDILEERARVLENRVRANGVLLEALRDDVRQIAEAHVVLSRR